MALTAIAGPLMNLFLGFIGLTLYALYVRFARDSWFYQAVVWFFYYFGYLNCYLAVFNLLPIPPFDGSRLAFAVLPDRIYWNVMKHERTIMLITIIAIIGLSRIGFNPFGIITDFIIDGVLGLYSLLLF